MEQTKEKGSALLGKRVRSYDFDHRRDCYVEGKVTGLVRVEGCLRYSILVDRDVWGGNRSTRRVGTRVFPPVNGTPTIFGGVTKFVEEV